MDKDTDALLQKADALMRRGRSYVANPPAPAANVSRPADESPGPVEEDVPVLTERVEADAAGLATAPPHMQAQLDALREEVGRWLEQELPQAVLKITDGLADQLVGELTHQAERNLLPRLIARLDGSEQKVD
jgi:hypothetical protein